MEGNEIEVLCNVAMMLYHNNIISDNRTLYNDQDFLLSDDHQANWYR